MIGTETLSRVFIPEYVDVLNNYFVSTPKALKNSVRDMGANFDIYLSSYGPFL